MERLYMVRFHTFYWRRGVQVYTPYYGRLIHMGTLNALSQLRLRGPTDLVLDPFFLSPFTPPYKLGFPFFFEYPSM